MKKTQKLPANNDTICALATPPGTSAIAILRLSGSNSFSICESIFIPKNKKLKLSKATSHSLHYGKIMNKNDQVDDVLVSVFKNPKSYTGEDY
jgi:tRNA modification GTPase